MPPAERSPVDEGPAAVLQTLAHGQLTPRDQEELFALKLLLEERLGFAGAGYKEKCLRRRIAVRMRACGVHRYADYGAVLAGDEAERSRLLDTLTINVSKFYRNAEVWALLRSKVLPAIAHAPGREIRIWSAGSAAGEETYSLAIMLLELARERTLDLSRFRITGTDVDRTILKQAERGEYSAFAFSELDPVLRERWFEGPHRDRVKAEVRRLVTFEPLDLIRDPLPEQQHLILCRNVIIYFERAVQERLFRSFHDALAGGGYLVLGKVETLYGEMSKSFRAIASRERIFQKP
jgi:chemotaxis methyl-accepting protein methylase